MLLLLATVLITLPVYADTYRCSYDGQSYVGMWSTGFGSASDCYSTSLFTNNTNTVVDWGAAPPSGLGVAGGTFSSGASVTTADGLVTIGVGTLTAGQTIVRADNNTSGWAGDFKYGDQLIGIGTPTSSGSIVITFSQPIYAVGFRISAVLAGTSLSWESYYVQDVKVTAYNINDTQTASYQLEDSLGAGTCTGLSPVLQCNTSPYIGIDSTSSLFGGSGATSPWIKSIVISDPGAVGFYLDQLQIQDQPAETVAPEPGTTLLIGSGLVLAAVCFRQRRNAKPATN
jgi:hypothetical protein